MKTYSSENQEVNGSEVVDYAWALAALQALESSQKGAKYIFLCTAPMNWMKSIASNPQY